ncbi:hypothetical protein E3N88_39823 [Mikania micrantha]|uniref:Reverse transcriptase zinc-binding domain-containing protein n=1 Tax=Mikania micrantha TaxID=192012 RepID=A0A5N6LKZ3_9ASTR|nr:hypothetical protein E3N88_39823 [Mikania micrantha]
MLAKWWWKLKTEKGRLWTRIIWSFHHNSSSWCYIPVSVSMPGVWKSIGKIGKDLLKCNVDLTKLISGKVGKGDQVRFWIDKWLGNDSFDKLFPSLFNKEVSKSCTIKERYNIVGRNIIWEWSWNVSNFNPQEQMELNNLSQLLLQANITNEEDAWRWEDPPNFSFSVNCIKRLCQKQSDRVWEERMDTNL